MWEERVITGKKALEDRAMLLESRNLSVPGGEDLILGLYEEERLVATGAIVENILQGIAVARDIEGEGAASIVVSSLVRKVIESGKEHIFLITRVLDAARFEAMGFSLLASAWIPFESTAGKKVFMQSNIDGVALLELGKSNLHKWLGSLSDVTRGKPKPAGSIIVNCNPFTMGHRRLLEWAASNSPWVYVLVVEEEKSLFPFPVRLELVKRGASDIPNLTVLSGGPYVISSATFPTYFTRPEKEDKNSTIVKMHAALDLEIFRRHIAPALNVDTRFVGTEPYCPTTNLYNQMMKTILPNPDGDMQAIKVREMPRFSINGEAVSASRVRAALKVGNLDAVRTMVPKTTWEWLVSHEAGPVLEKIRESDSRH
jgi:[citrate (pro-3S)-lyase] ligase